MSEEKKDEENVLDTAVATMAVSTAKKLAVYATENLPSLIWTEDGTPRLPEVHEWLRVHVPDPDLLTKGDLAQALEEAGEKYFEYGYINDLVNGIKNRWLRGGVNFGISFGSKVIAMYPSFVKEFQEKKDTILLTFLKNDASTLETYRLLEKRPKLTKFITEAFMVRMGIPLVAPTPTPPAGVQ